MKNRSEKGIGFFDSGVGGISVLRSVRSLLPNENYIYFGDSAHAPWGERTTEEIVSFSEEIVKDFLAKDVKCIVIACNTATSRAAAYLREKYKDVPIIGIEPAVKPAVFSGKHPKVLVLATYSTIKGQKLADLVEKFKDEGDVSLVAAPGIVEFVEAGITDKNVTAECKAYLAELTAHYKDYDCVVLGCTHFPFLRNAIMSNFAENTQCFDGAEGVARYVKTILLDNNMLNESSVAGNIEIANSDETKLELMNYLINA